MRILKKSLACLLVAIMAATAMFGCLVSADTITGQMSIGYIADITDGSTDPIEFSVTVSNGTNADGVGIAAIAAIVQVSANFEATYELSIPENTEDYTYTDGVIKCTDDTEVNNAEGKILIEAEANDGTGAWTYATVNVTVTPTAALTAGNAYSITVGTADEINGATYDEDGIIYTPATAELTVNYPMGHELNPYEIYGQYGRTSVGVNIPVGETVYVKAYSLSGYIFSFIDADNNALEGYTVAYGDITEPGFVLTENEAVFSITNTSDAELNGYVALYYNGDIDHPITAVLGSNSITATEGSKGYYYTYTAPADGTVTVTMPTDIGWTYVINNTTTYAYGDTQWSDSDPVVNPATVEVAKDDVLSIMVNTYDAANPWTAPAGTVNWTLAFAETVTGPVLDKNLAFRDVIVTVTSSVNIRYRVYKKTTDGIAGYQTLGYDHIEVVAYGTEYSFDAANLYNTVEIPEATVNMTANNNTGNTFVYEGISMISLGHKIYAYIKAYDANNNCVAYSPVREVSPESLIKDTIETAKTDNAKRTNIELLNMAAAAQVKFAADKTGTDLANDVAANKLVNLGVDQTLAITDLPELADVDNTPVWEDGIAADFQTAHKLSIAARLDKSPNLRVNVGGRTTLDTSKLKVEFSYFDPDATVNKVVTKTVEGTKAVQNGSRWAFDVPNLEFHNSNQTITAKVYYDVNGDGESELIGTLNYSIDASVKSTLSGSATAAVKDLNEAIAKFGLAFRVNKGIDTL